MNTRYCAILVTIFSLVAITPLTAGEGRVLLCASGRIEPATEERRLNFPVPGRIAEISVTEGATIATGDILARLEHHEELAAVKLTEAQIILARANVSRAKAELEKLVNGARVEEKLIAAANATQRMAAMERIRNGARKEERELAIAALNRRKAERENAERLVVRLRKLREGKAATEEELENALDSLNIAKATEAQSKANTDLVCGKARQEDLDMAEARYKAAKSNSDLVSGKARTEDLDIARAGLAEAEARLAAAEARQAGAKARLDKTILRSPVNGVVLKSLLRVGEHVSPAGGRPVMTVGDLSTLMVRVEVDEADIKKVKNRQAIYAEATGFKQKKKLTGQVVRIGRAMGRKRLFSQNPNERIDTQVMEVLVKLEGKPKLPIGLRLDVYFTK